MLGDIRQAKNVYIVCGYTDMRKGLNSLVPFVQQNFGIDPYSSSLFLFCGKRCDRLKALLWEPDGFVLLYKRLDNGRYQWPRNAQEVKPLTWEQFTWLMQGLNIEQPRAIRPGRRKKRKRLTKQRTCQTRSPSEKIVPWSGCVFLRAVLKIHGLSEKIH